MRRFAISDIHGCNKTFNKALGLIGFSKEDQLFILGDHIDDAWKKMDFSYTSMVTPNTPLSVSEINQMLNQVFLDQVLDIDAGCCYKNVKESGHSCVLELEEMNIFFQKNIES